MLIILVCWLALILIGASHREDNSPPLRKEQALSIRGICAIEIMIGHIGLATGSAVLYPNRKAGILFVGIFFMLSGYGLSHSVDHKPDYLRHFFKRRVVSLLTPAYLVYMIDILINWLVLNQRTVLDLFNLRIFLFTLNWYVWEQLFFYLTFWGAHCFSVKWREIVIGLAALGLIILAFLLKVSNPWYGSTMCFLVGICFYRLERSEFLLSLKRKNAIFVVLGITLILSMMAFYILGNDCVLGNPLARNIASVCFCIMTLIILSQVEIGNALSSFLGK